MHHLIQKMKHETLWKHVLHHGVGWGGGGGIFTFYIFLTDLVIFFKYEYFCSFLLLLCHHTHADMHRYAHTHGHPLPGHFAVAELMALSQHGHQIRDPIFFAGLKFSWHVNGQWDSGPTLFSTVISISKMSPADGGIPPLKRAKTLLLKLD